MSRIRERKANGKRRKLLGGAAAAGALSALGYGVPESVRAQSVTIQALLNSLLMPESLRPMVVEATNTRVELAPYTSVTDVVVKLTAPGGTARFDLMGTLTNVLRGPGLGEREGQEKPVCVAEALFRFLRPA